MVGVVRRRRRRRPPSISVNYRHESPFHSTPLHPHSSCLSSGSMRGVLDFATASPGLESRRCHRRRVVVVIGYILMTISSAHNPNLMHTTWNSVQREGSGGVREMYLCSLVIKYNDGGGMAELVAIGG